MHYFIVNKQTGEMRPYAPALESLVQTLPEEERDLGEQDTAGEKAPPRPPPKPKPLAPETELLIDTSREVYNPETGEVIPITPRPRVNPADHAARIDALEAQLAALEAQLAKQADSLLGFADTIVALAHLAGKTLPEVHEIARSLAKDEELGAAMLGEKEL